MRPLTQAQSHNGPRLIDEFVPGVGAVIDDVIVAAENAIGEPVFAHELPDVFLRVELGAFRRKGNDGDGVRDDQIRRKMPSGLVDEKCGMTTRLDLGGDGCQVEVHCFRVAPGQDQPDSLAPLGADGAKYVGRGSTLVLRRRRTRATKRPSAGNFVLLSDPRFIAKPDVYKVGGETEPMRDRLQDGREFFLKSSIAPVACA